MFAHMSYTEELRASAVLTVAENVTFRPGNPSTGAIAFVVEGINRTVGSVAVALTGSLTGATGSFFALGIADALVLSTDGRYYLAPNGPVPPYLGVSVIPGGGYDGSVSINAYSAASL